MAFIFGLFLAVFFVWLLVAVPAFRKFIVAVAVLIGAAYAYLRWQSDVQAERARTLIAPSEIDLSNLLLNNSYGSIRLTGSVKNRSRHKLTSVSLAVKAYDCPTHQITSACEVIGDTIAKSYVDVPAGQMRSLDTSVLFSDMPTPKNFVWTYGILEITASD